jgi:hypothetical protein
MGSMVSNHYNIDTTIDVAQTLTKTIADNNCDRVYQPKSFIINVDASSSDFIMKFNSTAFDVISDGMLLKSGIDYYFGDLETPISEFRIELVGTGDRAICVVNCFRYIMGV